MLKTREVGSTRLLLATDPGDDTQSSYGIERMTLSLPGSFLDISLDHSSLPLRLFIAGYRFSPEPPVDNSNRPPLFHSGYLECQIQGSSVVKFVDATSIPEYDARCSTGITKQYGGASLYSCGVADSMLHVKLLEVNRSTELRPAVCPQAGGYTS